MTSLLAPLHQVERGILFAAGTGVRAVEATARAIDVFGPVALIDLKRLAAFGAIAGECQRGDSAGVAHPTGLGAIDLLMGIALVRREDQAAFRAAAIRERRDRRAARRVFSTGFGAIDVLPGIVGAGAEAAAAVGADPGGGSMGGLTAAFRAIAAVAGVTWEGLATVGADPGDEGGGEDFTAQSRIVEPQANQHAAVEGRIKTVETGIEGEVKGAQLAAAAV